MSKASLELLNTLGLLSGNEPVDLSAFEEGALSKLLRYYYDQRSKTVNADVSDISPPQFWSERALVL